MGKNPRISVGKAVHRSKNLGEESVAVSKERRPLQETRQEIVCECQNINVKDIKRFAAQRSLESPARRDSDAHIAEMGSPRRQ